MKKALSYLVAATIAVTSFTQTSVAVQASPLKSVSGVNQATVQDVQYLYPRQGYYGGPQPYYGGNRYYGRGYYYGDGGYYGGRSYRHRRNNGGAIAAAGIVGLAAGVIAGQAMAQPRYASPAPVYGNRHAYCYSRYRSYDARSGTYLGYDGRRHYC